MIYGYIEYTSNNNTIKKKFDENTLEINLERQNITNILTIVNGSNINILNLGHNKLTSVPNFNLPQLQELYLWNNKLTSVPNFNLPLLQKLNLQNNKLTSVPNFNLPQLQGLDLANNKLTSVPNFNLPLLQRLYLGDNKLTSVPNFNLPLLQQLYLQHNKLTSVPNFNLPQLQKLQLGNNNLTSVPDFNLPLLQELYLGNNKLTSVPNFNLPQLQKLQLGNNSLISVPNFNLPLLQELYLQHNKLTSVPNFNLPQLQELDLWNNKLTSVPNFNLPLLRGLTLEYNNLTSIPVSLINLRNITLFHYHNNPIEYISPIIHRWIDNIGNQNHIHRLNIYTDGQNVHNSHIQECIIKSIYDIIQTKPVFDLNKSIEQILTDDVLDGITIEAIIEYSKDKTIHSVIGITFGELLSSVWSIIQMHKYKTDLKKILNTEIRSTICKCFTGRMSRLINVLNGFDSRVQITISDSEAIGNIVVLTRSKIDPYSAEAHRQLFQTEMLDRGYSQEIISEWLEYID